MENSVESKEIKIEFVENNSPSNSLRNVKMPLPILRKKSKYFVDNYKPPVQFPFSKEDL